MIISVYVVYIGIIVDGYDIGIPSVLIMMIALPKD